MHTHTHSVGSVIEGMAVHAHTRGRTHTPTLHHNSENRRQPCAKTYQVAVGGQLEAVGGIS